MKLPDAREIAEGCPPPAAAAQSARIFRALQATPVTHAAGIQTTPLLVPDTAGCFCGISVYPEGSAAPLHRHNCAEQIVVLQGQAELHVGDQCWQLGPRDAGWIPANLDHRYRNCGVGELHLLWIYERRDATRTLSADGVTVPMLAPAPSSPPPGDPS